MATVSEYNSNTDLVGEQNLFVLQTDQYVPTFSVVWTVHWGDGASETATDWYYTVHYHTYTTAGTYHITATADIGDGVIETGDLYVTIRPINPQALPSGAIPLTTTEGTLHIADFSGLPNGATTDFGFTGPIITDYSYGPGLRFTSLEVTSNGAKSLWFSYIAPRNGTLIIEATSAADDATEPIGVACSDTLYVLNEMFPVDYYPLTRAHMGVRVEQGKTYLFAFGISRADTLAGLYLDVKWSYQHRTIAGPCMYVLSGDSYGVLAYAVSLGKNPYAEPAMWMTADRAYWERPAGTLDGRLYVSRYVDYTLQGADYGLMKSVNEQLHVPPISTYDAGLYTTAQEQNLEWSEERQQLFSCDDYNAGRLKMPDQKFLYRSNGWAVEDPPGNGPHEGGLHEGDSFNIIAPVGLPATSVRVIAMTRWVIYNIGDTITIPLPTYSEQFAFPAFSDFVTISGGGTASVTFPTVDYPVDWDVLPVVHYMIVNSAGVVLAITEAGNSGNGPDGHIIFAFNEAGTQDYWQTAPDMTPPLPMREGDYIRHQNYPESYRGFYVRGNNLWIAELSDTEHVILSGGGFTSYGGPRQRMVARYSLDSGHVATETLRFAPQLIDPSPEEGSEGMRYFTINKTQTRMLVTYDKINPVPDPSNPYYFNQWYTGGMWIQIYDLTTPTPTFMHEFRFVPWPSLPSTVVSEPGFINYQFYAFGVIEFDPDDDNYAYMLNNGDAPIEGAPYTWERQHQTYVFRLPLYADYTTQYAAMRKPYLTFNNSDNLENYWFTFGRMGALAPDITVAGAVSDVKFHPRPTGTA